MKDYLKEIRGEYFSDIIKKECPCILDGWRFFDIQPCQNDSAFSVDTQFSLYAKKIMSFLRYCAENHIIPLVMYPKKSERVTVLDDILYDMGQEVCEVRFIVYTVNHWLIIDMHCSRSRAYYKYKLFNREGLEEEGYFRHDELRKWQNRLMRNLPAYSEHNELLDGFRNYDNTGSSAVHWSLIDNSDSLIVWCQHESVLLYLKSKKQYYLCGRYSRLKILKKNHFITLS